MNETEAKFKEWLNSKKYSYLYVDQSIDTFADFFKNLSKRPDFLVVVNRVGILAVDVKKREPHPDYILDESEEIEKYLEFERITRLPVWFVFGSDKDSYNVWHWIPLSKVLECRQRRSSKTKQPFRAISPKDCIAIQYNRDNISRIIE